VSARRDALRSLDLNTEQPLVRHTTSSSAI